MSTKGRWWMMASALAVGASVVLPVHAQDQPEPVQEGPWRIILKDQLKHEKGCDLNEVLTFEEIPLGDYVGVQGRVSCLDNRQFDFSRTRKHQKFRIELCEPSVC
ncbi:MAG: hypothetical protein JNN24_09085 [Hyphomicrobium zavarzinii]|uniref:hypothetical protein n=1 Tax=Hyphomicrobium zavarzinii TaxID=48292 RepID=UPI001A460AE5|nr:hypothetical protein [Hyphomicrobium zavarzinii]MBL8845908.1 hypothetical protein [Hyphomicrobium zavarzinii]